MTCKIFAGNGGLFASFPDTFFQLLYASWRFFNEALPVFHCSCMLYTSARALLATSLSGAMVVWYVCFVFDQVSIVSILSGTFFMGLLGVMATATAKATPVQTPFAISHKAVFHDSHDLASSFPTLFVCP